MRSHILAVAVLLATVSPGAITGQDAPTDQERRAITAEIESIMGSIRGPTDWEPFLAPDVEMVDFAASFSGKPAVVEHLSSLRAQYTEWAETDWEELSVDVLGSGAALVTGRFSVRRTHRDGRRQEGHAILTGIFERDQGEWLITRVHLSGSVRNVDGG